MKKSWDDEEELPAGCGCSVSLGVAAPAVAADLPARTYTKAPEVHAASYDWSGVFVGVNGGWGTANRCFDQTAPLVGLRRLP